ncbi:unnamed protein product [Chrysoparadoxa australica]
MIKARKPGLVMVSVGFILVTLVGIFLQWILEVETGKAPCLLPLIITYTSGYYCSMPTLLRAIYVIIMTNSTLRNKYSWMLRDKFLWSALALIFATGVFFGVMFGLTSTRYRCVPTERPRARPSCIFF